MRTLLVFEVEIDGGKRPTTRFRRIDGVVRSVGSFLARLTHVTSVRTVSVCDPADVDSLTAEVRYDGHQLWPPFDELPVGIKAR